MSKTILLNQSDWHFTKENPGIPTAVMGEAIALPHTWNAVDGQDGGNDYYRGTCWYTLALAKPTIPAGGKAVLQLDGAAMTAAVYLNGEKLAEHKGGYSTFRVDLTDHLKEENLLAISVDNSDNDTVYPQKADFTFYGGIYRDVTLHIVPAEHFALPANGAPALKVTPIVTDLAARTAEVTVEAAVVDAQNVTFALEGQTLTAPVEKGTAKVVFTLNNAHLWDGVDDPFLYTVSAKLDNGEETSARFGCRKFEIDPQKGFILNGREYPLRGVSRHQDRKGAGIALTNEMMEEDIALILEIGANTIRLAHYQHSQDFYDACDELGFAVWAEIPFISVFKKDPSAHQNCRHQMTELIIQNYNHPSIMFWGLSNEILIGGICQELVDNHHDLQKLVRELDPTRLTTIAHVSNTPVDGPMHHITDVESYNHYFGWYGGKMEQNGPWLDKFHAEHPDICIGISEYGTEGIINWHSNDPQCKDYTEEYQALYHEHLAQVFEDRPWVWATHCWNMFDFGCAARHEGGVAGRNNKGLMTIDRKTKKDSYFVYQAYWSKLPMVHIAGRRHAQRAGETTEIKVYSNQDTVVLYVNGKEVGQQTAHRVFKFNVALEEGFNTILAVAGDVKDSITLEKVEKEPDYYTLPEFNERQEGVANWFKQVGSLDLKAPMEFPEGYYSIKDSMEDLSKSEEALALATRAVKLATNFDIKPGVGMWDMMKRMTPETMAKMINMPDGFIESLNAQLIKIKK